MAIELPDPAAQEGHPAQLPIRKLRDASMSLLDIERIWQNYVAGASMRFETVKDRDRHTLTTVVRLETPLPTHELNRHLRSCVNDGRSALDNLITRLAHDHGATSEQLRKTAFPVAMTPREWKNALRRDLGPLPEAIVARVSNVQPFASKEPSAPPHPLTLLKELWNADKHRFSFSAVLGFSPQAGQSQLASFNATVETEHLDSFLQHVRDVDTAFQLDLGPIHDGKRQLVMRLPEWMDLDQLEFEPADVRVTMGLSAPGVSITDPAIVMLKNALRYARESVRYITGGLESPPQAFPPGLVERHLEAE